MRIFALTRYSSLGASSRMRFFQFRHACRAAKIAVRFSPLIDDKALRAKYADGRYSFISLVAAYARRVLGLVLLRERELIWVEKEVLPWVPFFFEKLLLRGRPYVLDLDDAVFHNYDKNSNYVIRYLMGSRIDNLMACARLVVVGNQYLAQRARKAGAAWVEVMPTVVDMDRYQVTDVDHLGDSLRVVWIGSPSTVKYLVEISAVLARVSKISPFILRIIGGGDVELPGVRVECISWSEDLEIRLIKECDVGIMPLRDGPWERGKCAYKLIQYMACGLPTIASAVGANNDVVVNGQTGHLVSTEDGWVNALCHLLGDPVSRKKMGCAGRVRVFERYSLQSNAPRLANLLRQAGDKGHSVSRCE
jgi:glycosyltransferase involved in cell wall biosynthesis